MSKSSVSTLEKLLGRFEERAAEIEWLEGADGPIRAAIDRLMEGPLSDISPKFFVLGPEQGELPAEQVENLTRIKHLRERMELIPGVLRRCKIKLEALSEDLQSAVEAETAALRAMALKQRDRFEKEVGDELRGRFGDCDGTRRMVLEAVRSCAANNAVEDMKHLSTKPAVAARALIKLRAALEGNETAAHSTPAGS